MQGTSDVLVTNTNPDIVFKNEENTDAFTNNENTDHLMTPELKEHLDRLAMLVKAEFPGFKLRVNEAYDIDYEHPQPAGRCLETDNCTSLHYEGRAADMTVVDGNGNPDTTQLARLGQLAVDAVSRGSSTRTTCRTSTLRYPRPRQRSPTPRRRPRARCAAGPPAPSTSRSCRDRRRGTSPQRTDEVCPVVGWWRTGNGEPGLGAPPGTIRSCRRGSGEGRGRSGPSPRTC
jgi:hypothetical protein